MCVCSGSVAGARAPAARFPRLAPRAAPPHSPARHIHINNGPQTQACFVFLTTTFTNIVEYNFIIISFKFQIN